MERRRNDFHTRGGDYLRAALVLVSVLQDFNSDWDRDFLSTARMDPLARGNGRAQRLLRNRRRMAALRNYASGIPTGKLGRATALRKRVLRGRHGRLRTSRSDRALCVADLWRRFAASTHRAAGPDGVRLISKTHAKQNGYIVRTELWNPFLKNCGGWAQQHSS